MQSTEKILDSLREDPVCGRHITEAQALLHAEYRGRNYLFCSERRRMPFALRPDSFAVDEGPPETEEAPGR